MFEQNENDPYRPATLLDDCLARYGLDRNRRALEDGKFLSYFRIEEFTDMEWKSRWVLGGASEDPAESLSGAFSMSLTIMRDSREKNLQVSKVCAFVVVSHGTGKCVFTNSVTGEECEYFDLPEADRKAIDEVAQHDLHQRVRLHDELPTRIVNIITVTGLAADVSIWHEGEVFVERVEQWVFDGEDTVPKGGGPIDDALMGTMTFTSLVHEALRRDYDLTIEGLMKVAWETADDPKLVAHLLKVIATGVEVGLLTDEDLPRPPVT